MKEVAGRGPEKQPAGCRGFCGHSRLVRSAVMDATAEELCWTNCS